MKKSKTSRGFPIIEFKDAYGAGCSVQKSSIADYHAIWLGIDDADPKILASKVVDGGVGWMSYPIRSDVSLTTRMHLNIEQAEQLIEVLKLFVETGDIS